MSIQMMSDLLDDLSTEQQQLLAGGVKGGEEDEETEGREEDDEQGTSLIPIGSTRVYTVRSRALVRVRRLR